MSADLPNPHYHVYAAPSDGPIRKFSTRATDVFATRTAAREWAKKHRPAERRIVRACCGGPSCPARVLPERGSRPALPKMEAQRSRRRTARLVRLRKAMDQLQPAQLEQLEDYLRLAMQVPTS